MWWDMKFLPCMELEDEWSRQYVLEIAEKLVEPGRIGRWLTPVKYNELGLVWWSSIHEGCFTNN